MRWSKAQKELLDLAQERVTRGAYCTEEIRDEHDLADDQLAHVLQYASVMSRRPEWRGPLNLRVFSRRISDAVRSLSMHAGTRGLGHLERVFNALDALRLKGHTQLCLWLMESRQLPVMDQEGFAFLVGYVAENLGMRVRIVFITGTVMRSVEGKRHKKRLLCLLSRRLRARPHVINHANLETLPGMDAPGEESEPIARVS